MKDTESRNYKLSVENSVSVSQTEQSKHFADQTLSTLNLNNGSPDDNLKSSQLARSDAPTCLPDFIVHIMEGQSTDMLSSDSKTPPMEQRPPSANDNL